ncbi:MAG: sugar transferase, partial [Pirellulaceae bacterium]|nr:sugar transferase [Pirellulaceae bacterium]
SDAVKRGVEVTIAALMLLFLAPFLVVFIVVSRATIGCPTFFFQTRPGRHNRLFRLLKFRTMTLSTDAQGKLLPDAQRLTKFGQFLRSTSLDELPELWNVIRGDMSLVGPRPLLVEYLPLYNERQARRHKVRPGITGWAQVNGRNAVSWEERLEMDVWYVENQSFWLDMKILWLTLFTVFRREGISQPGHATCEPFRGTSHETATVPNPNPVPERPQP